MVPEVEAWSDFFLKSPNSEKFLSNFPYETTNHQFLSETYCFGPVSKTLSDPEPPGDKMVFAEFLDRWV